LWQNYEAAGEGKDLFGLIDIGVNQNVRIPPGSRMVGYMPAGMVTIGYGNNEWAGGNNNNPFASAHFLPGSTLKVDGKILVENGVLKEF
jgi:hypothetical protein